MANFEEDTTESSSHVEFQMSSERDNCGLSSLLPISCRDRAEAFARSLQSRLSSLGNHSPSNERSWLGPHEKPLTLSQPLHNPDTERFLELETLESPGSPQDEIEQTEFVQLLNRDSLKNTNGDCHCPKFKEENTNPYVKHNGLVRHTSNDSDSEVFYDIDDDSTLQNHVNGFGNSESSKSPESETGIDVHSQEMPFCTSLDCTPQQSLSEDVSTLSLDDVEPTKTNGFLEDVGKGTDETDFTKCNGEEEKRCVSTLDIEIRMSIECPDKESDIRVTNEAEENEDEEHTPRVRRCSSLKTGKTPPGTPGRKKIVRFADVLGLDLADVRTFLDEIPKVPKSAYDDLSEADISDPSTDLTTSMNTKFHGIKTDKILVPMFDQPAGLPNFLDLVRDNYVCLENAFVDDPIMFSVKGFVRVRNLDFHKSVHIRYTLDSWKTYADVQGSYVNNSCDGFSDKFGFMIYAHTLTVGNRLEFACRFQCKGCQYWDSNNGSNYVFQCLPSASTPSCPPMTLSGHGDWGASFY